MFTTGLVSLSIHEALTFDGIEIALHPDLFSDPSSTRHNVVGRTNASIASSGTTALQKPHHLRNLSEGDGSDAIRPPILNSASFSGKIDEGGRPPLLTSTSFSKVDGGPSILNSASFSTAPSVSNRRLEVGDMIEIRVWDQLPGSERTSSPPSLKRRSPPASKDTSRGGSTSTSVTNEGPPTRKTTASTSATLEAAASTLQQSTASSLQYSIDSSFPTVSQEKNEEPSKEGDASTVSSLDKAKGDTMRLGGSNPPSPKGEVPLAVTAPVNETRSGVPPPFPRNRADTADGIVPRPPVATSKPPPVQRSRTSASAATDTQDARRRPAHKKAFHSRDISDMTMDTILGTHMPDLDDTTAADYEDDILSRISSTNTLRFSFVMLVTEKTLTSLKESARTQVSMLRQVADLYNLKYGDMVTINRINKSEEASVVKAVSADFVTVTIKESFISRGDMHFFQKALIGRWIYEGQRLSNSNKGVYAHAREIRHEKRLAKSGIITEDTMITFRSRSARIFWLVQISSEMWDYASPYSTVGDSNKESSCEIYFDKFVTFMRRLFVKWQKLEVTHSLTVIFFSRTYLTSGKATRHVGNLSDSDSEGPQEKSYLGGVHKGTGSHVDIDVCGRLYEDHFKTVIENETTTDWDSLIVRIKRDFVAYPFDVGWDLLSEDGRRPSTAAQGNILEAVNVTLNLMQFHYMDRDLHRTGNSVVIISPGCGVFEVDRRLAAITYRRMMDNGIGSDMLSLGLPPLHTAPFFHYNNDLFGVEAQGVDTEKSYHEVPHWMHLSFFSYCNEHLSPDSGQQSEDKVTGKARGVPSEDIEVAPNGFLIPNLRCEADRALMLQNARRASFSALANVAASPNTPKTVSKSQSRQRQLISGRDISDILEACRPRNSQHSVPSALSSLLSMYETLQNEKHLTSTESDGRAKATEDAFPWEASLRTQSESAQLKEWGAVDFDEVAAILKQASASLKSANETDGPHPKSRDQMSERSSPASSFSSQLSSLLGRSWEKVASIHNYASGFQLGSQQKADGIQLQRSPSIESLEKADGVQVDVSAGRESDGTSNCQDGLGGEKIGQEMVEGDGGTADSNPDVDNLKNLMEQQDKNFFVRNRAKSGDQQVALTASRVSEGLVASPVSAIPVRRISSGSAKAVGGLGAALQNYKGPSEAKPLSSDISVMKRNKSSVRLRESVNLNSPYSMSRSLGPWQDSLSTSPGRPPAVIPGGSQSPENIVAQRRPTKIGIRGKAQRVVNSSSGITAAAVSPPRFTSISQKAHRPVSSNTGIAAAAVSPPRFPSISQKAHRPVSSNTGIAAAAVSPPRFPSISQKAHRPVSSNTGIAAAAVSPPRYPSISQRVRSPPNSMSDLQSGRYSTSKKGNHSKRRTSTLNPFKQQDEEVVLARRSHNRRRWSHVFPLGEIEFKRHSGPNWKSLSQPAILPLTIDYYPAPQELNSFLIRTWDIPLADIDHTKYKSHSDLMMEMIRQRLTQDYQVVPQSIVQESRRRADAAAQLVAQDRAHGREVASPSKTSLSFLSREKNGKLRVLKTHDEQQGSPKQEEEVIKHNLSMGHTIHYLKYDPNDDEKKILVEQLSRRRAQDNSFNYKYLLYSPALKKYVPVVQEFHEFLPEYRWNQVDYLLGGIEEKKRSEMKFRQVMFALIPDAMADKAAEQTYIDNFHKLLDYLNNLRESDDAKDSLAVRVVSSGDSRLDPKVQVTRVRREAADTMVRLTVQLRKGKRDPYEWLDIAVEPTFDTRCSYRMLIQWLVASSSKVETQVQLLHRRCTQYGLKLVSVPELSISPNLFLNPFNAPSIVCIRDKARADLIDEAILERDFVDDGIHMTEKNFLECIDNADEYRFTGRRKRIAARQFVHRRGSLFIRLIRDEQGWVILAGIENRRLMQRDVGLAKVARHAFQQIRDFVNSVSTK